MHGTSRFVRQQLPLRAQQPQIPPNQQRESAPRGDGGRGSTENGRTAMIPGAFTYHRPSSVAEAVGLLADLGEDARPLAGGHSLIPMKKLRLATPGHLVDLAGLKDLKGISTD